MPLTKIINIQICHSIFFFSTTKTTIVTERKFSINTRFFISFNTKPNDIYYKESLLFLKVRYSVFKHKTKGTSKIWTKSITHGRHKKYFFSATIIYITSERKLWIHGTILFYIWNGCIFSTLNKNDRSVMLHVVVSEVEF